MPVVRSGEFIPRFIEVTHREAEMTVGRWAVLSQLSSMSRQISLPPGSVVICRMLKVSSDAAEPSWDFDRLVCWSCERDGFRPREVYEELRKLGLKDAYRVNRCERCYDRWAVRDGRISP